MVLTSAETRPEPRRHDQRIRHVLADERAGGDIPAQGYGGWIPAVCRRRDLAVTINNVARINVKLEVGGTTEQVTVEASAALLQSDKADMHVELNAKEVTDLPLANYRNYQSLINLVPGATPGDQQNSLLGAPARALATNINGTNRNNNITRLDGAVNLYLWLPHHTAYVAPADTVETVSVSTNNFDAEQGMAGGAAITVVTKSGTNELHGTAFGYHTNNHLKAKNFFFVGGTCRAARATWTAAPSAGPIKKDKLFFFGGWEGMRERQEASGTYTVPTADQRAGNFSAFGTAIYDPEHRHSRRPRPHAVSECHDSAEPAEPDRAEDAGPAAAAHASGTASNFFNSGTLQIQSRQLRREDELEPHGQALAVREIQRDERQCELRILPGPGGGDRWVPAVLPGNGHTLVQISTIGHTLTLLAALRGGRHVRLDADDAAGQEPGLRPESRA